MDIRNLGNFESIQAVWEAYPHGGIEGDYLYIPNTSGTKYRWNKYIQKWENAEVVTETPTRETITFSDVNVQNDLNVGGNAEVKGDLKVKGKVTIDPYYPDKDKKQSEINEEVDEALADRYTKDETYSQEELNNLITTPDQEYVTLEAESGDTLEDIFDGVTGATDTLYRVGCWNGTEYDTGYYSEYAWNGEKFKLLSVKDVGIDNEPTFGSNNLVKSGGVEKKIYPITEKSYNIISNQLWNGGTGDPFVSQGRYCSDKIPYRSTNIIDTDGSINEYLYYNDEQFLGSSPSYGGYSNANIVTWNYVRDENPTYIKIKGYIKDEIDNIGGTLVRDGKGLVRGSGIYSAISKATCGLNNTRKYYNNQGVLSSHSTVRCSDLLPINDNSVVIVHNSCGGSLYGNIVYFDENKDFLQSVSLTNTPLSGLYLTKTDFPNGAKYVAVNGDNTDDYDDPFVIITTVDSVYTYLDDNNEKLLSDLVWTDAGTPTPSHFSNLIKVTDGLIVSSKNPFKKFFRIILYDAGKRPLYNSDISFSDGEAKGEGGASGRFEGTIYEVPTGYGISYIKLQYVDSVGVPSVFFSVRKDVANAINEVSDVQCFRGAKLVTIGDSLTANCIWQPYLSKYKNLKWSSEETLTGVGYVKLSDGTYTTEDKSQDPEYRHAYPMAIGGTALRPSSANSIYIRALDAVYYNPDIILIYAGENDPISARTGANPWGDNSLSPKELVETSVAYKDGVISSAVNAMEAYKGMIELLCEKCPKAKIYLVTDMRCRCEIGMVATGGEYQGTVRFADMYDIIHYDNADRIKRADYVRALGDFYGLPVIDLMNDCGATHYNENSWYGEPAYDCTQVHPNNFGYMMMAKCMAAAL